MSKTGQLSIQLDEQLLDIQISPEASKALQLRNSPLVVEMELLFSCLIRKKLRFNENDTNSHLVEVSNWLSVGFKPVMTKRCSIDDVKDAPPKTDFPVAHAGKFIPCWLNIDFYKGEWRGDFGYLLER